MYVGMTRAKTHLRIFFARSRMLWGNTQANAPSRFLDDLPDSVTERRSDDILSAFAWGASKAFQSRSGKPIEPFRQKETLPEVEFNQDISFTVDTEVNQDAFSDGSRVDHPAFGQGTVLSKRGDIVDVRFDSGVRKSFALSIAPLKPI